jgi:predicted lipid-binding transport protein (Tim44 family)
VTVWHRLLAFALRHPQWWRFAVVAVVALAMVADAEARVGGGQRYGRPSGGSRGGYSGGGGGGEADILFLLIHLIIEVPIIGVPLTVMFVGFLFVRAIYGRSKGRVVHRTASPSAQASHTAHRRPARTPGLDGLRKADAGFSLPVFLDFAILVHRRALAAHSTDRWEPLVPFVSDDARKQLVAHHEWVARIEHVVVGGVRLNRVQRRGTSFFAEVIFESTRTEVDRDGVGREVLVHERWVFQRSVTATSLAPANMLALACPSCGSPVEVDALGACTACGSPITKGQLQWQVAQVEVGSREPAHAPEVGFVAGGDEDSVHYRTVQDPQLQAEVRKLLARHPDLSIEAFGQRVSLVYHRLQQAWSDNTWELARPYLTDAQFQSLRFWMDRYAKHGLANRLDDVSLERTAIVKVDTDAYYESITVRIWGSMKDYVVDLKTDQVVGGNAKTARRFSEYWTFLRAVGTDGSTKGDTEGCPSCGAPLDQVSHTGICGYCDSKITGGHFDWVLARIEQPEAYGG